MIPKSVIAEISDIIKKEDFVLAKRIIEREIVIINETFNFISVSADRLDIKYLENFKDENKLKLGFFAYEAYRTARKLKHNYSFRFIQIAHQAGYDASPIDHWLKSLVSYPK